MLRGGLVNPQGKPKEVVSGLNSPFFILTNARFEPADSRWPVCLEGVYDEAGAVIEHFSYCFSSSDLEQLGFPQRKQTSDLRDGGACNYSGTTDLARQDQQQTRCDLC